MISTSVQIPSRDVTTSQVVVVSLNTAPETYGAERLRLQTYLRGVASRLTR